MHRTSTCRLLPGFALAAALALLSAGCEPAKDDRPLTDFSCKLEWSALPEAMKAAGPPLPVAIYVTNTGTQAWPGWRGDGTRTRFVDFASRWWPVQSNAGKSIALFEDLAPGERVTVNLEIAPPAEPGSYVLRIEPVQEGVSWFGDRGDCVAKVPVSVTP